MNPRKSILAGLLALAATATLCAQGNLDPAGAPAPAMKTLAQVEARTDIRTLPGDSEALHVISAAGSYYLTGDLTGQDDKHGIKVTANYVSIDLGGFTVQGSESALDGINAPTITGVRVSNGRFSEWTRALNLGTNSRVKGVEVYSCYQEGIIVDSGALVTDSRASGSQLEGIRAKNPGAVLLRDTVTGNSKYGMIVTTGVLIHGCRAEDNVDTGIYILGSALIADSMAADNLGGGMGPGDTSLITGCVAVGNSIVNYSVRGLVTRSQANRAVPGSGANANLGHGILLLPPGAAMDCVANENHYGGIISGGASCMILRNQVSRNGQPAGSTATGISVNQPTNLVEANTVTENTGTGIFTNATTLVLRNRSTGNATNYNPASGTSFAPVQSPTTATNPSANF
jgi:hypothetical protein